MKLTFNSIGSMVSDVLNPSKKSSRSRKKTKYGIYRNGRKIGTSSSKRLARKRVRGKRGVSFRKIN